MTASFVEQLEPYASILDDFAVIAAAHPSENEIGAAAFATNALLAPHPSDPFRDERIDRRLRCFATGAETSMSTFRSDRQAARPPPGWSTTSSTNLLHEGYLVEPAAEGSPEIEKLRVELGARFWASSPDVWDSWGRKTLFRDRCRDILGDHSMPAGVELSVSEVDEVVAAVHRFSTAEAGTIIVKLPGTGGDHNRALSADDHNAWPEHVRRLWADRHPDSKDSIDVVIETWLPWTTTYSVSFMIAPDSEPKFLAACEQMLHPTSAAFVGSRSRGPLDADDRQAMITSLLPLVGAMRAEGYAGVAAIDVVIGPGTTWEGRGLVLPSEQRLCVIECNPRVNQHNRIGLIVARLARQWGVGESQLAWTATYRSPPTGERIAVLFPASEPPAESSTSPPDGATPARLLFAHRFDAAVELTITRPAPA